MSSPVMVANQTVTTTDYAVLDDALYIPLLVLTLLSSSLSIAGSSSVMAMARRENTRRRQILQRLLFGLSFADLVASLGLLAMPFALPSIEGLAGAMGNASSCTVVGFVFHTFAQVACAYNFLLSLYFWLVIRRNWREQHFAGWSEALAHLIAFAGPLAINLGAAVSQSINTHPQLNQVCLYTPSPWDCSGEDCERSSPEVAEIYATLAYVGLLVCSLSGFVFTFGVWWTARQTFRKSQAHTFGSVVVVATGEATTTQPPSSTSSSWFKVVSSLSGGRQSVKGGCRRESTSQSSTCSNQKIREVSTQAVLYTLVYLNVFIWVPLAMVFREVATPQTKFSTGFYVAMILFSILFPLQGFLNFFVYTRVKVNDWRRSDPDCSIFHIYRLILFGIPIPNRPPSSTDLPRTTTTPVVGVVSRKQSTMEPSGSERHLREEEEATIHVLTQRIAELEEENSTLKSTLERMEDQG